MKWSCETFPMYSFFKILFEFIFTRRRCYIIQLWTLTHLCTKSLNKRFHGEIFCQHRGLNPRPSGSSLLAWVLPSLQGFEYPWLITLPKLGASTLGDLRDVSETNRMATCNITQCLYIFSSGCLSALLTALFHQGQHEPYVVASGLALERSKLSIPDVRTVRTPVSRRNVVAPVSKSHIFFQSSNFSTTSAKFFAPKFYTDANEAVQDIKVNWLTKGHGSGLVVCRVGF